MSSVFEGMLEFLQAMEAANGANEKKVVIKKYLSSETENYAENIWMVKAALDQGMSYGIDQIPLRKEVNVEVGSDEQIDQQLKAMVDELAAGRGVTDEYLDSLLALMSTSPARYTVMSRILRKDLRCGAGGKTINAVFPGLIFSVPYQRCSGFDAVGKMTFPAILQRKANGMFAYIMPNGTFMTRKGYLFTLPGSGIHQELRQAMFGTSILMGELVVMDEHGTAPLSRAISNGIINSFITGQGQAEFADRIRAFVWGIVDEDEFLWGASARPYISLFRLLQNELAGGQYVKPIETWEVANLEEAQEKAKELIAKGEEGGILKSTSPRFVWRNESSSMYQIKMKAQAEAEFLITGIYRGEAGKKYQDALGGIHIQSGDGLIVCDVGGGKYMTDKFRKTPFEELEDQLINKIATVKFYGVTESPDRPEVYALDHPQLEDVRSFEKDVDEADTLEYCKKALLGEI